MPESMEICAFLIGQHRLVTPCESGRSALKRYMADLAALKPDLVEDRMVRLQATDSAPTVSTVGSLEAIRRRSGRGLGPSQLPSPTRGRGACFGVSISPGGLSSFGRCGRCAQHCVCPRSSASTASATSRKPRARCRRRRAPRRRRASGRAETRTTLTTATTSTQTCTCSAQVTHSGSGPTPSTVAQPHGLFGGGPRLAQGQLRFPAPQEPM